MHLDLRIPIGLMFVIFGVMLTLYGVFSDAAIYRQSLGIDINLIWGLVLLFFGIGMLALAWNRSKLTAAGKGASRNR